MSNDHPAEPPDKTVHESGHAVVAELLGLDLRGMFRRVTHVDKWGTETVQQLAAYYMAGIAAEEEILGASPKEHGQDDREQLAKLRREDADQAAAGEAQARELVSLHRPAVEALARRLRQPPTPQMQEVTELIERHRATK